MDQVWLDPGLVLGVVVQAPELSPFQISRQVTAKAGKQILGAHGVYNLLSREGLNTIARRVQYASSLQQTPEVQIAPLYEPEIPMYRLRMLLAPFVTVPKLVFRRPPVGILVTLLTFLPLTLVFLWLRSIVNASSQTSIVGLFFASIALTFGIFFFIYSLKYYLSVLLVLKLASRGQSPSYAEASGGQAKRVNPLLVNLEKVELEERPFVSIHVAVYNEKKVIGRLIQACTAQDWYQASSESKRLASSDNEASLNAERYTLNAKDNSANYEVVIVDDSTDETTELAKQTLIDADFRLINADLAGSARFGFNQQESAGDEVELFTFRKEGSPVVKLIHRASREGFKGGALQKALENTNPWAEYICVFDADFVPFPDTIEQFVKVFQVLNANETRMETPRMDANISINSHDLNSPTNSHNIAAVQGYQWHVLNKSENWVTRGVRTEYAGSYVVEIAGEEIYQGLKQIAGSVYAIRADILRAFGWGTSITEDFELTLRLYEAGYKVAFTPYIQAPAEAVSTVRRLIRQRMRWAEGASFNIKIMLSRMLFGHWVTSNNIILGSEATPESDSGQARMTGGGKVWVPSKLTLSEKLEFAYLSPYYLQAAFFVIGTLSWFISEAIFHTKLPFWSATFGWSLVFTNLLSLPLMNIIGLFLEESDERDYLGVFSFIALSYIVVPFQAYAAIKGFIEPQEGPWFRTPKTGVITDVFSRSRFYQWVGRLWPLGKTALTEARSMNYELRRANLALATISRQFNPVRSRKRLGFAVNFVIIFLLLFSTTLGYLSPMIPYRQASGEDIGAKVIVSDKKGSSLPNLFRFSLVKPAYAAEEEKFENQKDDEPEQEFQNGVLAINSNKTIYLPGEQAYIQMGSLDERGYSVCDSNLTLEIIRPSGKKFTPQVNKSGTCEPNNVTDNPDFYAYYQIPLILGTYQMTLTNDDNQYSISDNFEVRESIPFDIERVGATRINPFAAAYKMTLKVKANEDFNGKVVETVPATFEITNPSVAKAMEGKQNSNDQKEKQIIWQVDWKKRGTYELSYTFNAPDVSPQFYLLGPLRLVAVAPHSGQAPEDVVFEEARPWQIAADAAATTKQYIISGTADDPSTSSTEYSCLMGDGSYTWSSENARGSIIPTSGKLSNLKVRVNTAPGAGKSWTFAIRINGANSDLSVTISDTNTISSLDTDQVTVSAGDDTSISATPSGTPTAAAAVYWTAQFTPDTAGETILLANGNGA